MGLRCPPANGAISDGQLSSHHGPQPGPPLLLPPAPAATGAGGVGKRLLTMPAALRNHGHNLVHLLNWQQGTASPAVSRLAAPLASRWHYRPLPRDLGRV